MVQDGGGGKLGDACKVLILQIVVGVQAAAGQDSVLDAGGEDIPKASFQIRVTQFLQRTALRVVAQVLQIALAGPACGETGLLHELPANVRFRAGTILLLQGL